jgi:tripartite-type tricarboxylate transporter receptor subunit TctC
MKTRTCSLAALLLSLSVMALPAAAFPERTVTLLVPFGAGGSTDLIARALAMEMSKSLGQQVVVLNKAGAGGAIGAAEVANAKPDGHMVGMLPVGPLTTQPNLRKLSYSPASFEPICRVYSNPQVILVRKDSPFKSVNDLVAEARRNPGKLNYASPGTGSVPHLAMQALAKATSMDMVHVPYKGEADALQALIGGQVMMFVAHPTFLAAHAQTLRAMAVMAPTRLKEYADLPTLSEVGGPPLNFEVWGGLVTTKGTPPAAVAALEQACRSGTVAEAFRKQLETLNTPVLYQDGKTFGAFVAAEFERNGRLLRESGIQPE